ncbi:MAG: hypothetical protein GEV04_16655 [Actinophytocola sp.]|nr:hypothetical protein [Actinophytocola sp.]
MSRSLRAGLIVFGILSAVDLSLPLVSDGQHPPMAEAVIIAGIGLVSLMLIVLAWRGAGRAVIALVVLRALAAAAAVPALVIPGVPSGVTALAASAIVLTILGVALVLVGTRRPETAGVR